MSRRILGVLVVCMVLAAACGSDDPAPSPTGPSGDAGTTPVAAAEDGTTTTGGEVETGTAATSGSLAATTGSAAGEGSSTTQESTTTGSPEETTTSVEPSSTTTEYAGPVSPINGLPVADAALVGRKVIAVKVDNHWNARPQSGIVQADAVFELVVEAGITRFIAIFHQSDSDWVGPVRSVRPTDWTLAKPLNAALTISGGQPWITDMAFANDVPLVGDMGPPLTARWGERNAPHNLYVNTSEARRVTIDRGLDQTPPAALFERGPFSAEGGAVATYVFFDWTDATDVVWQWDGERYLRSVDGAPHEWRTREGDRIEQISTDVLVVLMAERYTACPPGDGSCVPAWDTVGENRAIVFAEGRYEEGRWRRDDAGDWFTLTGAGGDEIVVPPGRMWIMIYPETADLIR